MSTAISELFGDKKSRTNRSATRDYSIKLISARKDSTVGPICPNQPFMSMMISGKVIISNRFNSQTIVPGTFAVYHHGLEKDVKSAASSTSWVVISCPPSIARKIQRRGGNRSCASFEEPSVITNIVRLIAESHEPSDDHQWDLADNIEVLFEKYLDVEVINERSLSTSTALQLRDFLHDYRSHWISLEHASKALGKNPSHLARTFKKHFGLTVGDYLRILRVNDAFFALTDRENDLASVAIDCGFFDQSHLCRIFKRYIGFSPGKMANLLSR